MIQEIENNKLCGTCRRGIFLDGVVDGFYYCAVCNHQILFSVMDTEGKQSTGCRQHQIQNVMDAEGKQSTGSRQHQIQNVMDTDGEQCTGCFDCHHQIQSVMSTGVEENEGFYLLSYTRRKTTPFTEVKSEQISPLVPEEVVELEFGGPFVVRE
ncbi:hypothetical protein QQ045_004746 [Rhodiola kirilowii]